MMTENYLKIEQQRERLVASYQSLPEFDRSIVQLFSVIYTPISRTLCLDCLIQSGLWSNEPLLPATLKPYLDRLSVSNLLLPQVKNTLQIHPLIAEIATRDAVAAGRLTIMTQVVAVQLPVTQYRPNAPRQFNSRGEFIREVRLGLYRNDLGFINEQFSSYYDNRYLHSSDPILPAQLWHQVCNNPFDADWFATLIPELAETIWHNILDYSVDYLVPANLAFVALETASKNTIQPIDPQLRIKLVEQLLLRGNVSAAKQILDDFSAIWRDRVALLWGWWYFLQGEDRLAIVEYEIALKALKKGSGKRKNYFMTASGLFFILALLRRGEGGDLRMALEHIRIAIQANSWLSSTYSVLENIIELQMGQLNRRDIILRSTPIKTQHSLEILIRALCIHWIDKNATNQQLPHILEQFYSQATESGYHWLAMEAAGILAQINPTEKFQSYYQKQTTAYQQEIGIPSIVRLIQPQEPWEFSLKALTNLNQTAVTTIVERASNSQRLAWMITFYGANAWMLQPREQIINAKGEWSKGRNIAVKRLKTPGDFDYLTPQDLRVCTFLKAYNSHGSWGGVEYRFDDRAILSLISHPLVFWESNPTTRIEVVKGEPELTI